MPLPPKQGTCVECGRVGPVTGNVKDGFRCQLHYAQFSQRKSLKKQAQQGYQQARKSYLRQHPMCQAKLAGCWNAATEIHHKKGRTGSLLTDQAHFLAVCRPCHSQIEAMGAEAYELGLKEPRLS